MGLARVTRRALLALLPALSLLVLAGPASAGRLVESGHDFDFHCADQSTECNFVKVALNYARGGAPIPSKPVLVLDRDPSAIDPGNVPDVQTAINRAFGTGVVPMQIVDPRSATFASLPIDTTRYSAIFIASDINCGGCDLNNFPSGSAAQTPDATAIYNRTATIAAFFNAGGGIVAGSGAEDSGGIGGITFNSTNVPYYSFVASSGAGPATGPFQLTSLGAAIGINSADLLPSCGSGCTHNSFGFPPAGSGLKPAERDPATGRYITLVQDSDPPGSTITSGPGSTSGHSATFGFSSNESKSTFQCSTDNGAYGACGSPKTVTGLSDGKHTFNVRAVDLVGNVQPTPTSTSFCVPGGSEVPGNKVDEDCSGFAAPFEKIDASLRFAFRFTRRATTVTTLRVSKITRGSKVKVSCKGGGCPFRKAKTVRTRKRAASVAKLFTKKKGRHRRKAKLRRGATIRISLTKKGVISKVFSFKVRRGKVPSLKTLCQVPGSSKLRSSCPVFR